MIDRSALAIRRRKGIRQLKRWSCREITPRYIGRAGTTPVPCSCWMCGNPRHKMKGKKERLTIQEQRELLSVEIAEEFLLSR